MKWIVITVIAIIVVLVVIAFSIGPLMSHRVEQPKYTVIKKEKNIEIRQYKPMIIAEVTVKGSRREALKKGFRLIAGYIFGNNTAKEKVAMTTPVIQQSSQKIAMTAPVVAQRAKDGWMVRFIMPSKYNMENIPKPNNPEVKLIQIPAEQFIAIRFSGSNTNENIEKHQDQLDAYIKQHDVKVVGQPIHAFYNPPWTASFMRRNEILYQLAKD